jgi:hypothetical protein
MTVKQFYTKNQFIITDEDKITFQSYNSEIVTRDEDTKTITIFENWDYSQTTLKYFYLFLQEHIFFIWYEIKDKPNKKQAMQKFIEKYNNKQIKDSIYTLVYKQE